MEKSEKIDEVIETVDDIFLLVVLAYVRVLLGEVGLGLISGAVLFVSNPLMVETVICLLESCGAVRSQLHGNKIPWYPNHKLVMILYQQFYTIDVITKFLTCTDYFPVIVVGGVLPKKLRVSKNILTSEELDLDFRRLERRKQLFEQFTAFVNESVEDVLECFRGFRTSPRFENVLYQSRLQKALTAVALVFDYWIYSKWHFLDEKSHFFERIEQYIVKMCTAMNNNYEGLDIVESVKKCLICYLDSHSEIIVGSVNCIEGELLNAVNMKQAILYDASYYYIPDNILRAATEHIHEVISYPSIKAELHYEEVLICGATNENYTSKKMVVNAYGQIIRQRYLKLRKEAIDTGCQLNLTERRKDECTLVCVKDKYAE